MASAILAVTLGAPAMPKAAVRQTKRRRVCLDPNKVRRRRIELGLSQFQLSDKCYVALGTIENIESKPNHCCNPSTAKRVADALETTVPDIVRDDHPATPTSTDVYIESGLPTTLGEHLIGRDAELARLDQAWNDPSTNVLTVVGVGGNGKTVLVKHWLEKGGTNMRGAVAAMIWSFSGQGIDGSAVAPDEFITRAWEHFGDGSPIPQQWGRAAVRLAGFIGGSRNLLILDGLEVFQRPPGPEAGRIADTDPMLLLLSNLAARNAGLCIVTSRAPVPDLAVSRETTTPELTLDPLSESDAADFLRLLGLGGSTEMLQKLGAQVWGHPLSLLLVGRYIADLAPDDDLDQWVPKYFEQADDRMGGQNKRIMDQYCAWIEDPVKLALLKLVSLFDNAVAIEVIEHFRNLPTIGRLTSAIVSLSDHEWRLALADLGRSGLLNYRPGRQGDDPILHPIVREYFRRELQQQAQQDYREAHQRIYRFMLKRCEAQPVYYDEVLDLHQTVLHGLEAELFEEAFDDIIWSRLLQGFPAVSLHKFNAGALHLIVLRRFFCGGALRPENLTGTISDQTTRARIFWWAGMVLRLTGYVDQAVLMFQSGADEFVKAKDIVGEVASLTYVSRCRHTMGHIEQALTVARQSMELVKRDPGEFHKRFLASGNISPVLRIGLTVVCQVQRNKVPLFQRLVSFPLADSLHYHGQLDESLVIFDQAYQLKLPPLVNMWDLFIAHDAMYYDLLLTLGRYKEIIEIVAERLNSPKCSDALRSLMHTIGIRAQIASLDDPATLAEIAPRLHAHGEQIDYRSSHHYIRATIELAAAARRLRKPTVAARLLREARRLKTTLHWELGETDLLIEESLQNHQQGDTHIAIRQAATAMDLVHRNGYLLRQADVERLIVSFEECAEPVT